MISPQENPDLKSIYAVIQKDGKKELGSNKFRFLQIGKAARRIDEIAGLIILAQVNLYFNDFEEAKNYLLLAKKKSPNDIQIWQMFFSLYLFMGDWLKIKETIKELHCNSELELTNIDRKYFQVLFSYPICFYDLEALEEIMENHNLSDPNILIPRVQYTLKSIKSFGVNIDDVRDIIGLGVSIFYEKYVGLVDVDIFSVDEVNILFFVNVNSEEDLIYLNNQFVMKKIESKINDSHISGSFFSVDILEGNN